MTPGSDVATSLLVAFLNIVTPYSIAYTAFLILHLTYEAFFTVFLLSAPSWLSLYAISETIFFALYVYRRRRLLSTDSAPAIPSTPSRARLWKDAMRASDAHPLGREGIDQWLKGWFVRQQLVANGVSGTVRDWAERVSLVQNGAAEGDMEMSEIKRGNVEEWLAATFFNMPLADLLKQPFTHHALLSFVFALEHRRNRRFPSGYNNSLNPVRPTVDPIAMAHRPLFFYVAVGLANGIADWVLLSAGFRAYGATTGRSLGYHYHPGMRTSGAGIVCFLLSRFRQPVKDGLKRPIILLHGLGGYAPLLHLILSMLHLDRPIFVVHQPHVSFKLAFAGEPPFPTMPQMVDSVDAMLSEHGFNKQQASPRGMIVAHSLGSALAAALADHSASSRSYETVLVDPVSVLMYHPHLARSFHYGRPNTPLAHIVRYFALEMGVAQYMARSFTAFDSCLFLHEHVPGEPTSTKVIVGRNDFLNPVSDVLRECQQAEVECEVLENTDHGGFLSSFPTFLQVFQAIEGVSEKLQEKEMPKTVSMQMARTTTKQKVEAVLMGQAPSVIMLSRSPTVMGRTASRSISGVAPSMWHTPGAGMIPCGAAPSSWRTSGSGTIHCGMAAKMGRARSRTFGAGMAGQKMGDLGREMSRMEFRDERGAGCRLKI